MARHRRLTMAPNVHRQRLEDQLRRLLTQLIDRELRDPRLGMVSVTRVELTDDLAYGRAYLSSVGSDEEAEENLRIVTRAAGWLRREVSRRMHVKRAPELRFLKDEALSAEARIVELLREADGQEADGE